MSHSHSHHHTLAPSGQGTVMLNIGGTIGALIISAPGRLHGYEIEVSPVGAPDERTHAAVRARYVRGGVTFCVVLDALPAGRYDVWERGDTPLARGGVRGGAVTEYTWPAHAMPGRERIPV